MMMSGGFAIPFIILLIPLVAFGFLIAGIVLIARAFLKRGEGDRLNREEEMQLRRLMDSLQKLEGRIANLETILLERGAPREQDKL